MSVIDLDNLKTNIQSILSNANTTTADVPLSDNMVNGINSVLKLNPEVFPIEANCLPAVTTWIDGKTIEFQQIAVNQQNARRMATIDLKIVGFALNDSYTTYDEDSADNDCEYLMENIEEIIRRNPTINGIAKWTKPTTVTYHNLTLNDETHFRAGLMTLEVKIDY